MEMIKSELSQHSDDINEQNHLIDQTDAQIEIQTKDLTSLRTSLSSTLDQLTNSRRQVNENKRRVQSITQNLHRLIADAKPLTKEILVYQKRMKANDLEQNRLEMNFKQNETNIQQYGSVIAKLMVDSKEEQRILARESRCLQRYQQQIDKSKETIGELTKDQQLIEDHYDDLKQLSSQTEKENKVLKQQYAHVTYTLQLLGQREAMISDRLKPLYNKIQRLTQQHFDQGTSLIIILIDLRRVIYSIVKQIEQSKSDVIILQKYHHHLRSYHDQLNQLLSFTSRQRYEYLQVQSRASQRTFFEKQLQSNHIHHWHTLRISSPETFDRLSKVRFIKKKLTNKSNELTQLKEIYRQKTTVFRYLNAISRRREQFE